jgi:hypothetical protein
MRENSVIWPRFATAVLVSPLLLVGEGCGRRLVQLQPAGEPRAEVAELWQEPTDLEQRDLLLGSGGEALKPRETTFTFVREDRTGWSPGFDVRDREGIAWSVKVGLEAQPEVVTSRILWAIGYHQPASYYLDGWTLQGGPGGQVPPGRFRPQLPSQQVVGDWSWRENPFVGSQPYRGLVVANLILNNWDWKTSNNKIYRLQEPVNGLSRWYVVRDVGASLGKTSYPQILKWFRLRGFGQGTRNDLEGFESQGFITGVGEDSRIVFDYHGINGDIVRTVTPSDVKWTCALLARLSDRQWNDAFAAAGYTPEQTSRFVKKIKEKIAQGLALTVS